MRRSHSHRVILYVLLAGFLPFDEKTIVDLFQKIQNADFSYPKWFSTSIKEVISLILVADPASRISATELKQHPYLSHLFEPLPRPYSESVQVSRSPSVAVLNGKVQVPLLGPIGGSRPTEPNISSTNPNPTAAAAAAAAAAATATATDLQTTQLAADLQKLALQASDPSLHHNDIDDDADTSERWSDIYTALEDKIVSLKQLNVFDLVNQYGGFGMDVIFCPSNFYNIEALFPPSTSDIPSPRQLLPSTNVAGNIIFGNSVSSTSPTRLTMPTGGSTRQLSTSISASMSGGGPSSPTSTATVAASIATNPSPLALGSMGCYSFTSTVSPVHELIRSIYEGVKSAGWVIAHSDAESDKSGMVRATKLSPKGMLGIGINVFILSPSLSLVQIIRGKGDRLEWNKMYQELVDEKLSSVLLRQS